MVAETYITTLPHVLLLHYPISFAILGRLGSSRKIRQEIAVHTRGLKAAYTQYQGGTWIYNDIIITVLKESPL